MTPGFLESLGLEVELGRRFDREEHDAGDAVLVAHDAWVTRFGGDPSVVGRVVTLDDRAVRVVASSPRPRASTRPPRSRRGLRTALAIRAEARGTSA